MVGIRLSCALFFVFAMEWKKLHESQQVKCRDVMNGTVNFVKVSAPFLRSWGTKAPQPVDWKH